MKKLEIGKDYIGYTARAGQGELIYNGGISWTCKTKKGEMTIESQKQTDSILEIINRTSYSIGA